MRAKKMIIAKSSPIPEEFRVSCLIHHSIVKAKDCEQYWALVPLTKQEALNVGAVALIFPDGFKTLEAEEINREAIHLNEP